jgi:hypothetical protein
VDPRIVAAIEQMSRENPGWGYQRIQGELPGLGYRVAASTVRRVLKRLRIPPAPQRNHATWRQFLRTLYRFKTRCTGYELRLVSVGEVRHDRGPCPFACCA